MESTSQAQQRKITLGSLALVEARCPDFQLFNELLVQYPFGKPPVIRQVVPDNMVVLHTEPIKAKGSFNVPLQPVGPFWALATRTIGGAAAAGGVAMITMIGACGGFLGPYVTGRLRDATHSYAGGLYLVGGLALIAAVLSLVVGRPGRLKAS